jgi:hypothetical protein
VARYGLSPPLQRVTACAELIEEGAKTSDSSHSGLERLADPEVFTAIADSEGVWFGGTLGHKLKKGGRMRRRVLLVVSSVRINFSLTYATVAAGVPIKVPIMRLETPPAYDCSCPYMGVKFGGSWSNGAMTIFGAASGHVHRAASNSVTIGREQFMVGRRRSAGQPAHRAC